ncbi:MAG TPA: NADH-quinone oxidoreductase subunit N [Bacteroidetes bacterium]|nr:NADH-quinone oxidoreductase subunit N [Bacteroidota bacterium]
MDLSLPVIHIQSIYPQMILVLFAIIVVILPLFVHNLKRELLALISVVGLVLAYFSLINLWGQNLTGFNGMIVGDNFSIAFSIIFLVGAFLAVLLSLNTVENEYLNYSDFYSMLLFALVGLLMMVSSTNLLVIFIGLEILSISLYVLAGIRKMRVDSIEASLKYFLLGAFATGFLLYGIALLYGASGSIDLVEIGKYIQANGFSGTFILAGAAMLLIGLSFKAAFVPFHMWTPDVYQGAPTPVTAFMSAGVKGAALAVLLRFVWTIAPLSKADWTIAIWIIAFLTMTVGNVVAIAQSNVKRMLAYSSIAHAGYLLVGVLAGSQLGQASIMYYLLVYTMMNLGAFGVISYLGNSNKQENLNLRDYRGLGFKHPFAGLAMAIFMFSLAGVPPTGGFVGKFYLFNSAIQAGYLWLVIFGVMNSVISAYYYLRVVVNLYMHEPEKEVAVPKASLGLSFALLIAMVAVLQMGIMSSSYFEFFRQAVIAMP